MANPSPLPHHLARIPHLQAIVDTMEKLLSDIHAEDTLMYLIDTVNVNALPYLAEQFDVLGYRGYKLATTDQDKRNVIKNAVQLKKYNGTVWAIKQAMIATGYGGALLVENVPNGDPATDWANFTVQVDLGNSASLDADTPQELTKLINEYKNVRSKLIGISFICNVRETVPVPTETLDVEFQTNLNDIIDVSGFKYNGAYKYNGAKKYRPGVEDLQIQII